MNYTLYLTESEQAQYKEINPYTHLKQTSPKDLFALAIYPYFDYYSKRTPEIKMTPSSTVPKNKPELILEGEICIMFAENAFLTFLYNLLKNKNKTIFYINKDIATKDVEQTWKVLLANIDFHKKKKIYFLYPHFTKLVHAYRINTIYGKPIVDITY